MTEEMNNFVPEITPEVLSAEKKKMRRTFSVAGWSVFAATAATLLFSVIFSVVMGFLGEAAADAAFGKYLLIFNQIIVTLSMLVGAAVLAFLPKTTHAKSVLRAKEFFCYLCVCFAIGWLGNIIGNTWLTLWNSFTANEVTNPLNDLLTSISPWQMILCTGIAAPLIEEFIFRKLIIDRTRKYGDTAAIIMSAAFFGIFHQNFSQFFYAFGIGLVLGYVYCKTGRYRTVVLLHMIFNFVMGVIPALISGGFFEFYEKFMGMTEPSAEEMLSLLSTYAVPILAYLAYALVQGALNITGVVLFCLNVKKVKIEKSTLCIDAKAQRRAAVLNVGVIVSMALLIILTVSTLFT